MTNFLSEILSGSNDELAIQHIYDQIEYPQTLPQKRLVEAWELSGFIASSGFEILFEQEPSIDDFAKTFEDIGFLDISSIFQKVKAVVPDELIVKGSGSEVTDHLTKNFDLLKALFYEYLDVTAVSLLPAFGDFIREHEQDFASIS